MSNIIKFLKDNYQEFIFYLIVPSLIGWIENSGNKKFYPLIFILIAVETILMSVITKNKGKNKFLGFTFSIIFAISFCCQQYFYLYLEQSNKISLVCVMICLIMFLFNTFITSLLLSIK